MQASTLQALVTACAHLQHVPVHLACAILVILQQCQSHSGNRSVSLSADIAIAERAAELAARCCQDVAVHLSLGSAAAAAPSVVRTIARDYGSYSASDVASALDGQKVVLRGLRALFAEMIARCHQPTSFHDNIVRGTHPSTAAILPLEFGVCWTACSEKV